MNELKKRSNNWTDSERHSALSTILNQHDSLFGKFKGATLGNKAKEAKWDEIVMEINSCGGTRRTVEEVRKMYQNSKQRAKEKFFRSQKTGGGPGEQFSACDNLLLDKLKDTNVLTGIAGGVESGSYSFIIENDHDSSQPGTGACGRINENITSVECIQTTSTCASDSALMSSSTDEVPCVFAEKMQRKSRKRSTDVDELYELEKKRARVELQLAENRVAHENELFELKKAILEKNLEQVFSNSSIIPFNEL
ncbi:uncharacterized protein LOC128236714 [Mya arenaria]|uniref:uncharacterized protein LOC128233758 n=1 Tax=Mya arenaria TaxID=6604 RepID=UPI0022E17EBC|nr:uncharacterized protein LOC128233758 [Mya arenaria]XP_052807744.1 uncharacterized protein LOC128236714 [Mya arenaria]